MMKNSRFTKEERKEIIERAKSIRHTFNPTKYTTKQKMFRAMRYILKYGGLNSLRY